MELKARSDVVFSYGLPDLGILFADVPVGEVAGGIVYGARHGLRSPAAWLEDEAHRTALERLELGSGERVIVARNAVLFTIQPGGAERDIERMQRALELVALLEHESAPEVVAPLALPQQFAGLTALAERWNIADDVERAQRMEQAPDAELEQLWTAVERSWEPVQAYLAAQGEPLDESAIALQTLMEAGIEAHHDLARRRVRG